MPEIEVEGERDEAHQDDSVENENLICSICLEQVNESGDRSIARLVCKHQFHLDCIGSAFNTKGLMQCPNCRHIEQGEWLSCGHNCTPEEYIVEEYVVEEEAEFVDVEQPLEEEQHVDVHEGISSQEDHQDLQQHGEYHYVHVTHPGPCPHMARVGWEQYSTGQPFDGNFMQGAQQNPHYMPSVSYVSSSIVPANSGGPWSTYPRHYNSSGSSWMYPGYHHVQQQQHQNSHPMGFHHSTGQPQPGSIPAVRPNPLFRPSAAHPVQYNNRWVESSAERLQHLSLGVSGPGVNVRLDIPFRQPSYNEQQHSVGAQGGSVMWNGWQYTWVPPRPPPALQAPGPLHRNTSGARDGLLPLPAGPSGAWGSSGVSVGQATSSEVLRHNGNVSGSSASQIQCTCSTANRESGICLVHQHATQSQRPSITGNAAL